IAYLHLHGDHRIAPGATGDLQNWKEIILACKEIDSGINNIPVICEPFAVETVDECPPLGMDLPPAPPLPEYLDIAYPTFIKAGLPIAKAT
ncbi:hypothetical protein EB052_02355, partial [bacterium]|nr:hypothetical protein [bacterium]